MTRFNILMAACLSFASAAFAANPVVINVDDASPPFAYAAGGNVQGIYPALFYAAFKKIKVPVKIVAKPWNKAFAEAELGKTAIGDFYATPERLAKYDFSEPVFVENIAVFFNKKKPVDFKGVGDLYGKKVGVVRYRFYGDSFDSAKKVGGITAIEAGSDRDNLQRLTAGQLDAAIAIEESARAVLMSGYMTDIVQGKEYLISNKGHLAFLKSMGQADLLIRFNDAIADMKKDGTFGKIVKEEISRANSWMPPAK